MTSNKLSSRRQTARKPPICRSGPAVGSLQRQKQETPEPPVPAYKKQPGQDPIYTPRKGRCPPPPPPPPPSAVTCFINPDAPTVEFEGSLGIEISASNPNYDEDQIVGCVCTQTDGSFTCPTIYNGVQAWGEFQAPGNPGSHGLQADFSWPDSTNCTATTSVIEEEEPE